MKFTLAPLVMLAPSAMAGVGNDWSFTGHPKGGLKDITFPFLMANATHRAGYYFAQQFRFFNVSNISYCGLQPRKDQNGRSIVHGVFSSFQGGTTTTDKNCSPGADGGPGVSCKVEFSGDYRDTYNVVVRNKPGTRTWTGTVFNTVTQKEVHIGTWTLPAGAGGIASSQVGFVEYYLWNDGKQHDCSGMPRGEVVMGHPTSRTLGAGTGTIGKPYQYGNKDNKCHGRDIFWTEPSRNPAGWHITVGY